MLLLITGGSRGLGRAIGKVFTKQYIDIDNVGNNGTNNGDGNNDRNAFATTTSNNNSSNKSNDENDDEIIKKRQTLLLTIILVSRDMNGLQETSKQIFEQIPRQQQDQKQQQQQQPDIIQPATKRIRIDDDDRMTETAAAAAAAPSTTTSTSSMSSQRHQQQRTMTMSIGGGNIELTVQVICHSMDLSNLDILDTNLDMIFKDIPTGTCPATYDSIILVNNAGSIGYIGNIASNSPANTLQNMKSNIELNITSSLWITTRFLRHTTVATTSNAKTTNTATSTLTTSNNNIFVVNISSLTAISNNFPTLGIYSAGKACRNKFHTMIATELQSQESESHESSSAGDDKNSSNSNIKIINYAPGPLETQMVTEIRSNFDTLHNTLKPSYSDPTLLLPPEQSATKLYKLINSLIIGVESNDNTTTTAVLDDYSKIQFKSGDHIDYYDLP